MQSKSVRRGGRQWGMERGAGGSRGCFFQFDKLLHIDPKIVFEPDQYHLERAYQHCFASLRNQHL